MGSNIDDHAKIRLLRRKEVEDRIGLKCTTIYVMMEEGIFPRPCKFGKTSLWVESEVEGWIENLIAKRDEGEILA